MKGEDCGEKTLFLPLLFKAYSKADMTKVFVSILSLLLCMATVFSGYPFVKNSEIYNGIVSGLDFLKTDKADVNEPEDTKKEPDTTAEGTTEESATEKETTVPETTAPVTTAPETTVPVTTVPPVTQPPETKPPGTASPVVTEPPKDYTPPAPVSPTEFDNSLFIGDSRTLGLLYYGGLGKADVFATKGMTVFRAFTETISVKSKASTKLEPLLGSKKYEKVYIMLGINEIGGSLGAISKKYTELVELVKKTQPDATIYLCANLHITHARSLRDSTYNNTRLNAINDFIVTLADGNRVKYLDVNEIFDDSNGAFGAAYTTDDFHPMPKYYKQWTQWLGTVSKSEQ